ncbi:unnamed protein product [Alternaria alternata]
MALKHQINPVLLGRGRDTVNLDKSAILPILHEEFVTQAGFGEVFRVQLHPECHTFRDVLPSVDTTKWFALKRLKPRERGDLSKQALGFKKEVDALQRLHDRPNQHIVTLLATWAIEASVHDRYCLLFPWAEGDLKSYWKHQRYPCDGTKMDLDAIRWVTKQILGMAGALKTIHSPGYNNSLEPKQKYGRHGDIKAENILWYPPSAPNEKGTLVIADLGLTEFNSTQSRSNVPGEGLSATPGYRPPECDLKGGTVSRAFDIWTYGCLLLEMILSKESRVSQDKLQLPGTLELAYQKHAIAVKGEVHEWIVLLHNHPYCTQFIHDLLDLIEERMLVVIAPDCERIGSVELYTELDKMYRRVCDRTDEYCQKACQKKFPTKERVLVDALLSDQVLGVVRRTNPPLKPVTGETLRSKTPGELGDLW